MESANPNPSPAVRKAQPKKPIKAQPKRVVFKAGTYICPKCKNRIGVLVNMTAPPVCWSHKNHSVVEMERQK